MDYHKSFFQPVKFVGRGAGPGRGHAGATPPATRIWNPRRMVQERIPNQVDKSLQTTRRFDALKLWMTLRVMGADGIGQLFDEVCDLAADEHQQAHLGLHDGVPAFLTERYDPAHRELVGLYEPEPGDVGMHFLVAPTDRPVHGFTRAVITTVMAELFADPATRRVVVEPDVANTAVHALNAAVGFVPEREIQKPEKKALLSFCTREQFEKAVSA
ncbi:hypothetical protein STENM327S_02215 [Streptomyces tendae]